MRLVLWQEIPGWAFLFLTMAAFYPAFMFLLFSVIVDTDQEYFAAAAHFLNIVLSLICFIALAAEAPAFSSRMRAVPPDFQLMLHGAVSVQFCLHGDSGYHFDNIFLYLVYIVLHTVSNLVHGAGLGPVIQADASGKGSVGGAGIEQMPSAACAVSVVPLCQFFIGKASLYILFPPARSMFSADPFSASGEYCTGMCQSLGKGQAGC